MTSLKRHATYLLAVFALSVIIRLFQITAYADNSFGVGLVWSYDQNTHTLSISASGELNKMTDFDDPENDLLSDELPPWNNVINDIETVRIENGVLNIGMNAFYGSKSLKTVIISDGLTIIGSGAFSKCTALKSVVLPDTLKSIGADSFAECISLNDPLFPVNLNVIGSGAFSGCISIKNLRLSQNVTTVMPLAFSGCNNVEKIDVSDKNPVYLSIGNCLIDRNKKSLIFGCKNSVIPCDGTVTNIEPYAFYNCNGLESINVPQINGNKFHVCEGAFAGCLSLKNVRYFGNKSELEMLLKYNTDNNNEPLKNADRQCFNFPDILQNVWYTNAVKYVSTANIIVGYQNGNFGANDYLNRQDAVVILSRLSRENISAFSNSSGFSDVPENAYYTAAIIWGKKSDIVNGYLNGRFGVGDRITREQFLCFLYRYAKHSGFDTETTVDKRVFAEKFVDFDSVSPYAVDAVCWALEKGIISGRTADTIAPSGYAKRCEIAQIFYNVYKNNIFG